MEKYLVTFSKQAQKDLQLLSGDKLAEKARSILEIVEVNPFQDPPPYKRLRGPMDGMYSRRLNSKHRMVYEVRDWDGPEYAGVVNVVRMRTHYKSIGLLILP